MAQVAASYSSKSTAVRGALRAGLGEDAFTVEKNAEGRWIVLVIPSKQDEFEASEAELAAQQGRPSHEDEETGANNIEEADLFKGTDAASDEAAEQAAEVAATKKGRKGKKVEAVAVEVTSPKTPSYKQMTRLAKSEVEKPLSVIHSFLDENPTLTRKQAVAALVAKGINFYTARTQYQKWYTNKKAAK